MSGHSKWSTIKHRKGAQDAKRGKIFTKIIKEIYVATREGGGDESANPRLRTAILSARSANMPKDTIQRAIQKGMGEGDGENYQEIRYEGYALYGVAVLVDALTDNRNRTASDIRSIFSKHGGNLGESGCVSYLFEKTGVILYDANQYKEDAILEGVLEVGAQDVIAHHDDIEVRCDPKQLHSVVVALEALQFRHKIAEIVSIPTATLQLTTEETEKVLKLIERLDDHDDVKEVATNLDIPDDYQIIG